MKWRKRKWFSVFSVILLMLTGLCGHRLYAQVSLPDTIQAFKTHEHIVLDGVLNEPDWQKAQFIHNFTQRELKEGQPATEKTRVAVLFDDKTLYIGVWCYDDATDKLIVRSVKRDFDFDNDDNFKIILDTYGDKRNGYLFVTNPFGARFDAMVINNGQKENEDWNGVWNVKTKVTHNGWFAEFEIPFSTLRFRVHNKQAWGVNFERDIRRKREEVLWQGWSRNARIEQVTRAGTLTGIHDVSKTTLIELKPYGITGIQLSKGDKPLTTGNIGGDINYLITPTIKLNLTVNTDFAQVESDRIQVNLTRFSLYYPEKREFFLEGKNYFDFNMGYSIRPFYSRRIGIAPDRSPVPIIGGVRLMGKTGRTTLAGLSIQTSREDSLPSTQYSVLRWRQDVGKNSSIGIIGVGKFLPGRKNLVYGTDFLYSTSELKGGRNLSAGGSIAQSYTSDGVRKKGTAQYLFVEYPNDKLDFSAVWNRSGEGFNPETGFLRRKNYQMYSMDMHIKPRPVWLPWIRRLVFKPFDFNYYIDDATKKMQSLWTEFRPLGFTTKSGEFFEFNIQRKGENLTRDFEIHNGIIIPVGEYWFTDWELQFETFQGRPLYGATFVNWGGFYNGHRTVWENEVSLKINRYVVVRADYSRNDISLPGGSFVVHEMGGRLDVAVNPDLFGSLFGQWNNEDNEILLNFRINWIPKPGTNFYFVVNQMYDTSGDSLNLVNTVIQTKLIWRFVI